MTKTTKIIYAILITVILGLVWYTLLIQPKVKAWEDLIQTQSRLEELEDLIKEAKENYEIAEKAKYECIDSREKEKEKAHDDAEKYRIEMKELQGFLLNR